MKRIFPALAVFGLLTACSGDGTNPFMEEVELTDDPSTRNSKFLFNIEDKLTMNDVQYDEASNEIIINNLPFDGPDGIYEHNRVVTRANGNHDVFRSIKTPTTGRIRNYAVFMRNEDMKVAAAAGADWSDFGYAGANVKRDTFNLPGGVGEYRYLGTYAGVRARGDSTGLHIVTGDVELLLDTKDFDAKLASVGENGENIVLEGAIVAAIRNRSRTDAETGRDITRDLPTLSLTVVQFDPETLSFDSGVVVGNRSEGTWGGLIGGADGQSIGAYVNVEGSAEFQTVQYEVIEWTDPATGAGGIVRGYTGEQFDTIRARVESGEYVDRLLADRSDIPAGSTLEIRTEGILFESAVDARETGVLLTERLPTDLTPEP